MLETVIYSVKNNMIDSFDVNHFWKHIHSLSLTNKKIAESCRVILIPLYKSKIKSLSNLVFLPASVLSYIYPDTISYSYNPLKFVVPSREEIEERYKQEKIFYT